MGGGRPRVQAHDQLMFPSWFCTDLLWVFEPLVHGLVIPLDFSLQYVLSELEPLACLPRSHRARRTHRHDGKHVGNKCKQRTAASFPMIP